MATGVISTYSLATHLPTHHFKASQTCAWPISWQLHAPSRRTHTLVMILPQRRGGVVLCHNESATGHEPGRSSGKGYLPTTYRGTSNFHNSDSRHRKLGINGCSNTGNTGVVNVTILRIRFSRSTIRVHNRHTESLSVRRLI